MKECKCCNKELEDSKFAKHTRPSGKIDLQHECKKCNSLNRAKYQKEHNRETAETKKNRRVIARQFILTYKVNHPCIVCSEKDPVVLDLHHRNPSEKDLEIGSVVGNGWSLKKIQQELDKCDVLCANCHRREHYKHADIV